MSMEQSKVTRAEEIIGYTFADRSWIIEALQAAGSSVLRAGGRFILQGNKGLAGIGDRIATSIITEACYDRGQTIGATNSAISRQLANERMAIICDNSGLTTCVNAHIGQCGQLGERTKAAIVEAIIRAGYKEGGLVLARQIMENLGIIEGSPEGH